MPRLTLIFDFDSTLARSLPEVKKIFLEIALELNYPADQKMINRLIHRETKEIIKEVKLPLWKLPKIERLFRLKMEKSIEKIKPFPEMKSILPKVKEQGYRLGILTSNNKKNVERFLKKHHLEDYFDFIDGGSSFFGKAKKLKKLLRKEKLERNEAVYIGDEVRDIQAAQKIKMRVIAVGWGVNPPQLLLKYQPDFLAKKPKDLLKILNKIC
ncbi:HAD-IA family hydrolase [Candidatus Shapirobacteria bacterium]|nr:HAD-IA family hydrolase [Candidatus Shapirobacteria bacterium]